MKNLILGLSFLFVLAVSVSCKKKKDDNNTKCGEQELKVATTPANGANDAAQPGTDFSLYVKIETMPAGGATITVTAKAEGSSSPYFTTTIENALEANSILITKTPKNVTCVVETVVTSKTCNTNQWKGSYRYAAK
ncbi:hypothetical protein [Niastella sp. OAS944]|uniref:hypothetical protein n=1 Tax=Niastella sp. OAS944 TaxID=2664089 RepID=UPI00346FFD25|nr:hypothetical protein [Chitinophagaceae bacterium OAS944]